MLRVNTLAESGKMLKLQHQFSSKKHKIYKSYDVETQQTYLTKIIVAKDEYLSLYYQHHLQSNVMNYLTMTKSRGSTILNAIPYNSSVMIKETQRAKDQEEMPNKQSISKVIYMSKSFIPGCTLREMVQSQDNRLNSQFSLSLVGNILDFILRCGGVNDLIISSQNIIVGEDSSFHLNYFSTVGLDLLKFDRYIPKIDFEQIFPYLTSRYIDKCNVTHQYDVEIHLNFIVINFITAFFKKDILFQVDFEHQVKKESIKQQMNKLEKRFLPTLVTQKQLSTLINQQYGKAYGRQLMELIKCTLQRSFRNEETKNNVSQKGQINKETLYDWEWILKLLCREKSRDSTIAQKQFVDQHFRCFASSLMELINHYNNILNYLLTNNLQPEKIKLPDIKEVRASLFKSIKGNQQIQLSDKDLRRLIETAHSLFRERKFYYERGWYIKELYFPIKTGMTFTRIIQFPNWLCMLAKQTQVNLDNITAVLNLLELILQIEEDVKLLEPFITQSVLINTLQINKICKKNQAQYKFKHQNQYYNQKGQPIETYRQIILHEQMTHSIMENENREIQKVETNEKKKKKKSRRKKSWELQSDKDEDQQQLQCNKEQNQQQKKQHTSQALVLRFRELFRQTLTKLKAFIQKYYLTVSERKVRDNIRINCQPQSKIIHQIEKYFGNNKKKSSKMNSQIKKADI